MELSRDDKVWLLTEARRILDWPEAVLVIRQEIVITCKKGVGVSLPNPLPVEWLGKHDILSYTSYLMFRSIHKFLYLPDMAADTYPSSSDPLSSWYRLDELDRL